MLCDLRALSCCAVAALGSTLQAQTVPTYSTETRWTVNTVIPPTGATSITLTLQGRAIYNGAFPTDTPTSLYGDFGIMAMGFGPNSGQSSTISRSDPSVIIHRGDWGVYTLHNDAGDPVTTPFLRGASPGVYDPIGLALTRGMRLGVNDSGAGVPENPNPNSPNPPGPGQIDNGINGSWTPQGDMSPLNQFRTDFQSTTPQARNLLDPAGGAAWMDLYRIQIDTLTPVIVGPGGFTVDFNGWLRAAGTSLRLGGNWNLQGGASVPSAASIGFTSVPSPAVGTLLGLAAIATRRRRPAP